MDVRWCAHAREWSRLLRHESLEGWIEVKGQSLERVDLSAWNVG